MLIKTNYANKICVVLCCSCFLQQEKCDTLPLWRKAQSLLCSPSIVRTMWKQEIRAQLDNFPCFTQQYCNFFSQIWFDGTFLEDRTQTIVGRPWKETCISTRMCVHTHAHTDKSKGFSLNNPGNWSGMSAENYLRSLGSPPLGITVLRSNRFIVNLLMSGVYIFGLPILCWEIAWGLELGGGMDLSRV